MQHGPHKLGLGAVIVTFQYQELHIVFRGPNVVIHGHEKKILFEFLHGGPTF